MVKKYIGLPIFKKKPLGWYGPQKISWNHFLRMPWAMHVKIQNLGLADTCSPSGKKWYQIPEQTGLKRGRRHDWRSTSGAIFFLQWMALDSVFYLPLHHTTCIFSLPVCRGGPAAHLLGGPTYRNQHSIFHQAPKTTQYYVFFEAENITAGVEQGRGEDRVIKRLKRADVPLLP